MVTSKTKLGFVLLKQAGPGRFTAAWRCPVSRKYLRRRLPASSLEEARELARAINADVAQRKGYGGVWKGRPAAGHAVSEAGLEAIRHSGASERTRRDYMCRFNAFIDWLDQARPEVTHWRQVSEALLADYLEACRRANLAPDSIRLRLYAVRLTAAHMARIWPAEYRNTASGLRYRRPDQPAAAQPVLAPARLLALLDWLSGHDPRVHVWAALRGLAGLRGFEAAYLQRGDVDLAAGTVLIRTTAAHAPKNRASHRRIPLCPPALAALAGWIERMPDGPAEAWLFAPDRRRDPRRARLPETAAGALCMDQVCALTRRALAAARAAGVDLPAGFRPRRLRAGFITALRKARVDFEDLQRYVGQTPASVLGRYYDECDPERLAVIAETAGRVFAAA